MLRTTVVSNIEGVDRWLPALPSVAYAVQSVGADFQLDLDGADALLVPNGSDHVAMHRNRERVRTFLEAGHALLCFDGWFTDWIPGNRWVLDNTKVTRDWRYFVRTDRYGLFDGFDLDALNFSQGMSGWWACGYIDAAADADVLLVDTWGRPMMVLDESTTAGTMILTASGPLPGLQPDDPLSGLYHRLLVHLQARVTTSLAQQAT